jgi:hypothetical protein
MTVEVHPQLRQTLRRSALLGASLAGDGLLVRMRSTMIATLGVVAAVGLALVAVALQIGWPSVLSGPLPQAPGPTFARNATIAAPASPAGRLSSTGRPGQRRHRAGSPPTGAPTQTSELTAGNAVESPASGSPPASHQPSAPESGGHGAPSTQAPAPSPDQAPTPGDEPAPGDAAPPANEAPPPPVAASPESAPGHSGESHGHHYGGGPPPWAGQPGADASSSDGSPGHGHDDHDGGWGHH